MNSSGSRTALRAAVFSVAIAIVFSLTAFSLYLNRTATAGVAAAFMLALALFWQLPVLESLEVLTLKAKFRARVSEAEELLGQLRGSAAALGRIAYVQLAYMNRLGDIGWARKRALLIDLDDALRAVNLPEVELATFKIPFLNLLSLDLSRVFEHDVAHRAHHYGAQVERQISEYPKPIIDGDPKWAALLAERNRNSEAARSIDWGEPLSNPDLRDIRRRLTEWLDQTPLPAEDKAKLLPLLTEVADMSEESWRAGAPTDAAIAFIKEYQYPVAQRAKIAFPE